MSQSLDLRIIIPACNEFSRIEPTIRDYCVEFETTATILVVANGCTDGTPDLVRSLQSIYSNLQLIEIGGRIGKGGAVRSGLWTGSERFVGFVDADGSTSAVEFRRLYEVLRQNNSDGVIGSRWMRGAHVEPRQPFVRRLASRAFNSIVKLLFGLPYADTQCGAKVFTRDAITQIAHSLELADFAFDIEVLWRLKRAHFNILELPTLWADRQHGTKIRLFGSSLSMLKSILRLRVRESWLGMLPFIDRFAHKTTIPVVDRHPVLVLGGELGELRRSRVFDEFCTTLEDTGFRLYDASEAVEGWRALGSLNILLWYVLRSNRQYDAIIEVASATPSVIPYFSMKPSFLVTTPERPLLAGGATQHHSSLIDLCSVLPADAASTVLLVQSGASLYDAVFYSGKDNMSLHYPTGAGYWNRHVLNR